MNLCPPLDTPRNYIQPFSLVKENEDPHSVMIEKINHQQKKIPKLTDKPLSLGACIASFYAVALTLPLYYFAMIGMGYSMDALGIGITSLYSDDKCYDKDLIFLGQPYLGGMVLLTIMIIGMCLATPHLSKQR